MKRTHTCGELAKKDDKKWCIKVAAIISIAALEACNLLSGNDGAMFIGAVAAIAGIAGYKISESLTK